MGQPAVGDGAQHLGLGAGGEDIVVRLGETAHDGHDLVGRLARTEDRLRHPVPEPPVQIDAGEPEVLHRQVAQPRERPLRRDGAAGDLFQQRPYFFPIHRSASFALPLRKPWRSSVTK